MEGIPARASSRGRQSWGTYLESEKLPGEREAGGGLTLFSGRWNVLEGVT